MTDETILTAEQEVAQRAERLSRVQAIEKAEADEQAKRVEQAAASTRGTNEAFFEKQRRLEEEARNNKPVVLKRQTNEDAVRAEQERYPRPALNKPQEGFSDPHSVQPCKRNPSITLQPASAKYPPSDPRCGMSEELIRRMGMEVDPRKPALKSKK